MAAAPYPAYGAASLVPDGGYAYPAYGAASLVPDGGCALSSLRSGIASAGWWLCLIRPTERHRLCRMAATPYPAYGAALVVGLISEAHQAIERKNV